MVVENHRGAPLASSMMEESREGKMKADGGTLKEGNPEFSYRGIETGLHIKIGTFRKNGYILRPIELAQ